MKNNLVLIGENDNLVVECLNDEFEFVHDKTDGSNWFNQKTLASMFGVGQSSISRSLKTLDKRFSNNMRNSNIINLAVKSNRRNSNMLFYNFKVVTMLASRINTPEAFDMLEWIDSSLNTMFNVVTGKTSINSNKDWLKNQCEVKAVQAETCRKSSNDLYGCGLKHDGDKLWSKYKKFNAEALKYKELYLDYDRIDKIVANERNNPTKQLKLI